MIWKYVKKVCKIAFGRLSKIFLFVCSKSYSYIHTYTICMHIGCFNAQKTMVLRLKNLSILLFNRLFDINSKKYMFFTKSFCNKRVI